MGQKLIVVIEQINYSHSPTIVSVSAGIHCGVLPSLVHENKCERSLSHRNSKDGESGPVGMSHFISNISGIIPSYLIIELK